MAMYTKTKNWDKVGKLLPSVSAPKYHGLYAKAKEADGHYQEAALAYKTAQDYDNFVRYGSHLPLVSVFSVGQMGMYWWMGKM